MSLDIDQREHESVIILDLKGRITTGEEATLFRETVHQLASKDAPKLILNMKNVDYIDSTGLGAIVVCSTAVRKAGGAAKLLHLSRRTIELLVMTKLATIFEIFNDEQDAVNSFFPDREIKRFDILNFVKEQQQKKS
ncbi:MAG: STAS domain-containing protein [Acidobacteria bacterium]|nr:STAS domain-containing protein [Acidobacteriota bacterium]MBI3471436.1 STAS domain-containing protein [Candidatus Solibacter usitatus]